MSKSLQDQLKALGLAKDPAPRQVFDRNPKPNPRSARPAAGRNSAPKQTHPGQKLPRPPGKHRTSTIQENKLTLEQAYVLREQQSRAEAEALKENKRLEDLKRRQINSAIKAIVQPNRLNDPAAEVGRHFIYKERIRKVNVTLQQFKAINEGKLGLVYLSGGYHVLSSEHVEQVRVLSQEHVPDLSGGEEDEEQFPVPDDLIW